MQVLLLIAYRSIGSISPVADIFRLAQGNGEAVGTDDLFVEFIQRFFRSDDRSAGVAEVAQFPADGGVGQHRIRYVAIHDAQLIDAIFHVERVEDFHFERASAGAVFDFPFKRTIQDTLAHGRFHIQEVGTGADSLQSGDGYAFPEARIEFAVSDWPGDNGIIRIHPIADISASFQVRPSLAQHLFRVKIAVVVVCIRDRDEIIFFMVDQSAITFGKLVFGNAESMSYALIRAFHFDFGHVVFLAGRVVHGAPVEDFFHVVAHIHLEDQAGLIGIFEIGGGDARARELVDFVALEAIEAIGCPCRDLEAALCVGFVRVVGGNGIVCQHSDDFAVEFDEINIRCIGAVGNFEAVVEQRLCDIICFEEFGNIWAGIDLIGYPDHSDDEFVHCSGVQAERPGCLDGTAVSKR